MKMRIMKRLIWNRECKTASALSAEKSPIRRVGDCGGVFVGMTGGVGWLGEGTSMA